MAAPSPEESRKPNCVGVDPDVFFPHNQVRDAQIAAIKAAQAICEGCVIIEECLQYAEDKPEKLGVWGGRYFGPKPSRRKSLDLYLAELD